MEAADSVFLAFISFVSSLWYIARLGFYSDDWSLFDAFRVSSNPMTAGVVRGIFLDRPVQGVYSILLYRLFGLRPLGYHVANAIVLAWIAVVLYRVLRRLQPSRTFAFGVALLYVTLPNYSTDRFWFAAFGAELSIVFYLLSLLADLHAAGCRGMGLAFRRIAAIGALLISVMLYETALPFFFLNPLLAWYARTGRRDLTSPSSTPPEQGSQSRFPFFAFAGINWLVLVAVAIYKAKTSPRLHTPRGVPALMWSIATKLFRPGFKDGDYGLNLRAAFNVNFGDYLLRLPATVWLLHHNHPLAWLPLMAITFGAVVFAYARLMPSDFTLPRSIALVPIGVGVFLLGYSMFLTNNAIQITPTGIGNRTSIAAALGVALAATGLFGAIARAFPHAQARASAFAALLGLYAGSGFFVISTLSSFWIDAYAAEQAVESDLQTHIVSFPPRTTLLVGGLCSYVGPGIVFESDWDLSGALRLLYGDRTLAADVLRPRFYEVTDRGIATVIYEGEDDYDFSPGLLLYDFRRKTTQALTDKATALKVIDGRLDAACAYGSEGVGARVF